MYKMKELISVCLLGALVMFFNGCSGKEVDEKTKKEERALPVKVARVKRGSIEEVIYLTGNIKGEKEVQIYADVPGKLIKKLKDVGDPVKKDEVIAMIDRDEVALKFSEAEVKSPIDGEVTRYFADLGESVFPAQSMPRSPLVMVADMDKVKVIVNIIEKDVGRVKVGQEARIYVDAYPEKPFIGYVKTVSKSLDLLSRTAQAEIVIDNPEHFLKPGMFAKVNLIVKRYIGVIIIPRTALIEREDENVVFTIKEGMAEKRIVKCGVLNDTKVQIIKGLNEGEDVIVEGNYGLIEGTKIKVSTGGVE